MSCNSCTNTKLLHTCAGNLTLGAIASNNTDVYIFVLSPSGYLYRQSATSSGSGVVTLDLSEPSTYFYHANGTFEVWVTLQTGDVNAKQTVTIGGTGYTCFNLNFTKSFDNDDAANTVTTQTLAIE